MTTGLLCRITPAFLAAVVVTAVIGSVIQTQINLAALADLGAQVSAQARLTTTWQDLLGFGPVMAAIAVASFIPAFAAASRTARSLPLPPGLLYATAGMAGLLATFWLMGFFTPMPTLVAAVRGLGGLIAVSAAGLGGGLTFAALGPRTLKRRTV